MIESGPQTGTADDQRFKKLIRGSSISMLGSRLSTVAYPLLVLAVTGSPVAAGWTSFAAIAPGILAYLPAGVLIDRSANPRRVMRMSESARGVAIGGLAVAVGFGVHPIALLVGLAFVEQTFKVVSELAERRFVTDFLQPNQEASGLARTEAWTQLAVMVGRPLGGVFFGIASALPFSIDALTFVFSARVLASFRGSPRSSVRRRTVTWLGKFAKGHPGGVILEAFEVRRPSVSAGSEQAPSLPVRREIREAARWLWGNTFTRMAVPLTACTTLVGQALIIIFIAEAHKQKALPAVIGIALGMSGLGGTVGSAFAARLFSKFGYSLLTFQMRAWLAVLCCLALTSKSITWMAIAMLLMGFTGALGNVAVDTYLVRNAGEKLARVHSVDKLTSLLACAVGPLLGGVSAGYLGTRSSIYVLVGVTALLPIAGFLASPLGRPEESKTATPEKPEAGILNEQGSVAGIPAPTV